MDRRIIFFYFTIVFIFDLVHTATRINTQAAKSQSLKVNKQNKNIVHKPNIRKENTVNKASKVHKKTVNKEPHNEISPLDEEILKNGKVNISRNYDDGEYDGRDYDGRDYNAYDNIDSDKTKFKKINEKYHNEEDQVEANNDEEISEEDVDGEDEHNENLDENLNLTLENLYDHTSTSQEEDSPDANKRQRLNFSQRPLKVGDTFTPHEMLPIAEKLISKVEEPGQGKGIVSSAKTAQHLADTLFQGFFLTPQRIVKLTEYDIVGLDALQALAMSGEVASVSEAKKLLRMSNEKKEEEKKENTHMGTTETYDALNEQPKLSKYTLLTKPLEAKARNLLSVKRRGIKLAKNLGKKRLLKVNKGRRRRLYRYRKNGDATETIPRENNPSDNLTQRYAKLKNKTVCHWIYECADPPKLDTCTLNTTCIKYNSTFTTPKFIGVKHRPDEHSEGFMKFRKMLGITIIDEEVEKLLESRVLHLTPSNMENMERIESLSEYFQKIITADLERGGTTPMPNFRRHKGKNNKGTTISQDKQQNDIDLQSLKDEHQNYLKSRIKNKSKGHIM